MLLLRPQLNHRPPFLVPADFDVDQQTVSDLVAAYFRFVRKSRMNRALGLGKGCHGEDSTLLFFLDQVLLLIALEAQVDRKLGEIALQMADHKLQVSILNCDTIIFSLSEGWPLLMNLL